MSPRSSSGSWAANGADIIDLDRFMRGARPPEHRQHSQNHTFSRLVVDGGAGRKAGSSAGSGGEHSHYYSHDSGLSDGSYRRRRTRHAARNPAVCAAVHGSAPAASRPRGSLRSFRAACERALLEQQQQIARVAQLCERLAERAPPPPAAPVTPAPPSADTSDLSSSSRSTRDQRRKDKHRTDECKTYKIIMNKLDELNRLFSARARCPAERPRARRASSSGSVSVSDKLVATEPPRPAPAPAPTPAPAPSPAPAFVERAAGSGHSKDSGKGTLACSVRAVGVRAVTHTYAVDISPTDAMPVLHKGRCSPNVATESVIKCESSCESKTSACDPRCGFDLDDPVHLYCQAKRMQNRMSRSDGRRRSDGSRSGPRAGPRAGRGAGPEERGGSLCGLCRGYWRALRHFVAAQLAGCPDGGPCSS